MIVIAGRIEDILLPRYDAHVEAWYRWKWLFEHFLVDRAGIVLVGRRRGQKAFAIARQ